MTQLDSTLALFEAHREDLHALGRRLARSHAEADDLVQETMLRAFVHKESFVVGTNARAWLSRILRNLFVDRQRKKKADQRLEGALAREFAAVVALDPATELEAARTRKRVRDALETVPEPFRRAVELVDLEGFDYESAALALGCPEGTIMSRVHRGRRRVEQSLSRVGVLPALVA